MTPFRRTLDAAMLKHQAVAAEQGGPESINKWEVLRELTAARSVFGLSDRELAVLQTLLSFHRPTDLCREDGDLIVFPSNAAICERLNGIPCSTMRRHLGGLVRAGFIVRRDSPNGKRFVKRAGGSPQAFGFDLAPLVARFAEICEAAHRVREEQEQYQRLRQTVSLMRRDIAGLAEYGARLRPELTLWDAYSDRAVLTARELRRKLSLGQLKALEVGLKSVLDELRCALEFDDVCQDMSTSDVENEHHYQNSNKDTYDSEHRLEKAKEGQGGGLPKDGLPNESDEEEPDLPTVPLGLVLSCCEEIKTYASDPIRHWHDLVRTVEVVRPMMGISPSAWEDAVRAMGPEVAAVVVAAMLERFGDIQSPGGYLRHLARKADAGAFSCGPMVMALMRRAA